MPENPPPTMENRLGYDAAVDYAIGFHLSQHDTVDPLVLQRTIEFVSSEKLPNDLDQSLRSKGLYTTPGIDGNGGEGAHYMRRETLFRDADISEYARQSKNQFGPLAIPSTGRQEALDQAMAFGIDQVFASTDGITLVSIDEQSLEEEHLTRLQGVIACSRPAAFDPESRKALLGQIVIAHAGEPDESNKDHVSTQQAPSLPSSQRSSAPQEPHQGLRTPAQRHAAQNDPNAEGIWALPPRTPAQKHHDARHADAQHPERQNQVLKHQEASSPPEDQLTWKDLIPPQKPNSFSLSMVLNDPERFPDLERGTLWIDKANEMSAAELSKVVAIAKEYNTRIICADSSFAGNGDTERTPGYLLNQEGNCPIHKIQGAFSTAGTPSDALHPATGGPARVDFRHLKEIGCVLPTTTEHLPQKMAKEIARAAKEGRPLRVIAQPHLAQKITQLARKQLRLQGSIKETRDVTVGFRKVSRTQGQRNMATYKEGMILSRDTERGARSLAILGTNSKSGDIQVIGLSSPDRTILQTPLGSITTGQNAAHELLSIQDAAKYTLYERTTLNLGVDDQVRFTTAKTNATNPNGPNTSPTPEALQTQKGAVSSFTEEGNPIIRLEQGQNGANDRVNAAVSSSIWHEFNPAADTIRHATVDTPGDLAEIQNLQQKPTLLAITNPESFPNLPQTLTQAIQASEDNFAVCTSDVSGVEQMVGTPEIENERGEEQRFQLDIDVAREERPEGMNPDINS